MALITCLECGRGISDKAVSCPGCGCPVENEDKTNEMQNQISCSYIDNINRKSICVESNFVKLYAGNKIICTSDISQVTILFYCKKNCFGVGTLCGIMPGMNNVFMLAAKGESCNKMEEFYNSIRTHCIIKLQASQKAALNYKTEEFQKKVLQNKIQQKQNIGDLKDAFQTLAIVTSGSKVPKCPKCRSTQITYGGNRISRGRAVVGGAVAGPAGATLGGLTGKKGYAVCLNCGKRWKI